MKKKHRLLSLLLAFAMMLTFMPAMAFADEDEGDAPTSAAFSVIVNDDAVYKQYDYELNPAESVELAYSDGLTAEVTVKASRLVATGNSNTVLFRVKPDQTGNWEAASGRKLNAETPNNWGSLNLTDNPVNLPTDVNKNTPTKFDYGWVFTKNEVTGTLKVSFDFSETEVFKTDPTGNYDNVFYANPNNLIVWSDGEDFSDDSGAWITKKAEEAAAKAGLKGKKEDYVNAVDAANKSKEAAAEAMKTPGDAAVAAAQTALDDAKKAKKAAEDFGAAFEGLDEIDQLYIKNAGDKTEYAEDLNTIATDANYEALQDAIDKAESKLDKAETQNAAKKAGEDRAAAEKAKNEAENEIAKMKVKKVTVNTATVDAAAVAKAVEKAGGSKDFVTTIVLGKKVKKIKKGAFKEYKNAKLLVVKTTKLKRSKIKKSLKGSAITKVRVSVGKDSQNKKYLNRYKKIFTKKIVGKKVTLEYIAKK